MSKPRDVRVTEPNRQQLEWRTSDLESTLPDDHQARLIWEAVGRLDLTRFYDSIRSREGHAGRPATDPRVLLVLWIFATSEGVGSARELERLCDSHDAYRWIRGGVPVNYHTLSDFRVEHGDALDQLMTQLLGVLMKQGLVKLDVVAQDGMRVRASAGASSFRREVTLQECLTEAAAQVAALKTEIAEDPSSHATRRRAAKERAAKERVQALERALEEMPSVRAAKEKKAARDKKKKLSEPRVSTTDPEARVMKMADGGFRPAYNVQFATDADTRVIVGVSVTNAGVDAHQMPPMIDEISSRTGRVPAAYLVDGGFVTLDAIEATHAKNVTVYAPLPKRTAKTAGRQRRRGDVAAIVDWRSRMETDSAKLLYRRRAATAETVNADVRCHRGLERLPVRGHRRVRCVVLLAALTYNLRRHLSAPLA